MITIYYKFQFRYKEKDFKGEWISDSPLFGNYDQALEGASFHNQKKHIKPSFWEYRVIRVCEDSSPTTFEDLIGTEWIPKSDTMGLPWKITNVFVSPRTGTEAVELHKYQGGRNSPAILTIKRLKQRFNRS